MRPEVPAHTQQYSVLKEHGSLPTDDYAVDLATAPAAFVRCLPAPHLATSTTFHMMTQCATRYSDLALSLRTQGVLVQLHITLSAHVTSRMRE